MSIKNTTTTNEIVDSLKDETMKLNSTSKKIRYLLANGKTRGEVVKLLAQYGVTTKDGGPIIYQFVNNVMNQKVKE